MVNVRPQVSVAVASWLLAAVLVARLTVACKALAFGYWYA
jgi:hypothetical protein